MMAETDFATSIGLCCTCNNAPSCFNLARRGPALYCELFDDYLPLLTPAGGPAAVSPITSPTADERDRAAGLCVNCEHRRTCLHPRPDGGVWHCEDYE